MRPITFRSKPSLIRILVLRAARPGQLIKAVRAVDADADLGPIRGPIRPACRGHGNGRSPILMS